MSPGQDAVEDSGQTDYLGGRSLWTDIDGPVHYLDFGGPARGPLILCVHGLGGSAVNSAAIAPLLTRGCRLIAPDLAGHGLTRSAGRGTDVGSNRQLLHRFLQTVTDEPVILMGNSMGGMISVLEASAAPHLVSGLILIDPALPFVPARPDPVVAAMFAAGATPGLGPLLLRRIHRLPEEAIVAAVLSLCCADPSRVPPDVVDLHVRVARQRAGFAGTAGELAASARSVIATAGLGGREYREALRSITVPVLLLHGEHDRLVPVSAARAAARSHPEWSVALLPDAGHVAQLEVPLECATAIAEWLAGPGREAARLTVPAWPAIITSRLRHRSQHGRRGRAAQQ
jgi:pimeloyl-ACP methyl ester carboxylesterase